MMRVNEAETMKLSFVCNLEKNNYFGTKETVAKKYIQTLQDHIKYVIEAGKRLGVSDDQLNIHDDSKWSEAEFPGYAMHFQGGGAPDEFSKAWLHHIHFNPHHWQYWIFSDGYTPKNSQVENGAVEIPYKYSLEMVADWMGARRAYTGSWDMAHWLTQNMSKIKVHSKTAEVLRAILDTHGYADVVYVYKFANEL